jgi:hypothetical protein
MKSVDVVVSAVPHIPCEHIPITNAEATADTVPLSNISILCGALKIVNALKLLNVPMKR